MIKYIPVNEDSAIERIDFVKDNVKITFVNRFDSYAVYIDDEDDDFDMDEYDPEQGAMMSFVDEEEGERVEYSIEGDISQEEKQELIESFQENYESGPEELGWEWSDRELWYYGSIKRTKVKE
jgi:hypothetical protein